MLIAAKYPRYLKHTPCSLLNLGNGMVFHFMPTSQNNIPKNWRLDVNQQHLYDKLRTLEKILYIFSVEEGNGNNWINGMRNEN